MVADERGQGSVETLFILMVLVVTLFGAFELGQGVMLKHALDVSTEKGARLLSINPADFTTAEATIRREVDANLLGGGYGSQVSVRLYDAATLTEISPAALTNAALGYRFLLTAELTWQAHVPFTPLSPRALQAGHHGVVDRVRP